MTRAHKSIRAFNRVRNAEGQGKFLDSAPPVGGAAGGGERKKGEKAFPFIQPMLSPTGKERMAHGFISHFLVSVEIARQISAAESAAERSKFDFCGLIDSPHERHNDSRTPLNFAANDSFGSLRASAPEFADAPFVGRANEDFRDGGQVSPGLMATDDDRAGVTARRVVQEKERGAAAAKGVSVVSAASRMPRKRTASGFGVGSRRARQTSLAGLVDDLPAELRPSVIKILLRKLSGLVALKDQQLRMVCEVCSEKDDVACQMEEKVRRLKEELAALALLHRGPQEPTDWQDNLSSQSPFSSFQRQLEHPLDSRGSAQFSDAECVDRPPRAASAAPRRQAAEESPAASATANASAARGKARPARRGRPAGGAGNAGRATAVNESEIETERFAGRLCFSGGSVQLAASAEDSSERARVAQVQQQEPQNDENLSTFQRNLYFQHELTPLQFADGSTDSGAASERAEQDGVLREICKLRGRLHVLQADVDRMAGPDGDTPKAEFSGRPLEDSEFASTPSLQQTPLMKSGPPRRSGATGSGSQSLNKPLLLRSFSGRAAQQQAVPPLQQEQPLGQRGLLVAQLPPPHHRTPPPQRQQQAPRHRSVEPQSPKSRPTATPWSLPPTANHTYNNSNKSAASAVVQHEEPYRAAAVKPAARRSNEATAIVAPSSSSSSSPSAPRPSHILSYRSEVSSLVAAGAVAHLTSFTPPAGEGNEADEHEGEDDPRYDNPTTNGTTISRNVSANSSSSTLTQPTAGAGGSARAPLPPPQHPVLPAAELPAADFASQPSVSAAGFRTSASFRNAQRSAVSASSNFSFVGGRPHQLHGGGANNFAQPTQWSASGSVSAVSPLLQLNSSQTIVPGAPSKQTSYGSGSVDFQHHLQNGTVPDGAFHQSVYRRVHQQVMPNQQPPPAAPRQPPANPLFSIHQQQQLERQLSSSSSSGGSAGGERIDQRSSSSVMVVAGMYHSAAAHEVTETRGRRGQEDDAADELALYESLEHQNRLRTESLAESIAIGQEMERGASLLDDFHHSMQDDRERFVEVSSSGTEEHGEPAGVFEVTVV